MKKKYFFVIYLHDVNIKSILDWMRIIADPSQRNFAHLTVKGPYSTRQKKRLDDDSELIKGKEIKVLGAGNFFSESQNTVFLKCEERKELYSIWKAKDDKTYKDFHPHITIYDGNNKMFAQKLFNIINSHSIDFSFTVDRLELYSSADKTKLFNLRAQTAENYQMLTKLSDVVVTADNIDSLTPDQRIQVIDHLCDVLEKIHSNQNIVDNTLTTNGNSLLVDI